MHLVTYLHPRLPTDSAEEPSLFSFERAVHSSVVLGLVGAGGIGMLLEEPMAWHQYQQATTVIITIFVLLVVVEQISGLMRKHVLS